MTVSSPLDGGGQPDRRRFPGVPPRVRAVPIVQGLSAGIASALGSDFRSEYRPRSSYRPNEERHCDHLRAFLSLPCAHGLSSGRDACLDIYGSMSFQIALAATMARNDRAPPGDLTRRTFHFLILLRVNLILWHEAITISYDCAATDDRTKLPSAICALLKLAVHEMHRTRTEIEFSECITYVPSILDELTDFLGGFRISSKRTFRYTSKS